MYTKENFVLVRYDDDANSYSIMSKDMRGMALIDDKDEHQTVVDFLLKSNAEIYDNIQNYWIIYPPLSSEEIMAFSKRFLEK